MLKKRLINTSDDESEDDGKSCMKSVKSRKTLISSHVLSKVLNRSATSYFNSSFRSKSHQMSLHQDNVLKFCLKDIIPFRYLDHIFMGLTQDGNFLISYKRMSLENENHYDFYSGYKYELFFWIYRPHYPLSRYYVVNLFDDHGAHDVKCVTMTQWKSDSKTLIVHGSSEIDELPSFLTIVKVPKLGCLACKQLRETSETPFQSLELCIQCNLTIHTKYHYDDPTQFDPKINMNAPDYIIMCENSFIHTINVKLDMQKSRVIGCGFLNSRYLNRPLEKDENEIIAQGRDQNNVVNNKNSPPDMPTTQKVSIVEQILADFSEYDIECPSLFSTNSKTLVTDVVNNGCEKIKTLISSKSSIIKPPRKVREIGESSTKVNSQLKPSSPQSPELLEAAEKTYEFSEENEKCEKISIFRKRRLADKKYEFSEENTENIIPFNRTRSLRRPIYQLRTSPHPSFRSPCGSPVANRCIMSPPPGFMSPSYNNNNNPYRSSPTHHLLYSPPSKTVRIHGNMSPAGSVDDVQKYFSDIMNRLKDNRVESGNESSHDDIIKPNCKDFPTFSKKLVNYYVEEDDAISVITCDEDDCISPGYHLSLPMEVHGSCYTKMQIVSKASLSRLKGVPRAIVTQNSFDIETFSIHVANKLCKENNKKYKFILDIIFEIVHVCPLSHEALCMLHLKFAANNCDHLSKCLNCANDSECFTHREFLESTILFTWKISGNDWRILDYGQLKKLGTFKRGSHPGNSRQKKLHSFGNKMFGRNLCHSGNSDHLRILDSNEDKSKESLVDLRNGIEFFRRQPFNSPSSVSMLSSNSSASGSSDSESCDELQQ
ncbi:CLUMA_CG017013, isoform A [Clunio marinus]|uniref:CLUMA_CG017013, isoform A n=1 Tax=Clunio marinus TaxID=568069 RepID=A0A1J1IZ70_9DIPT|nr:CLUMA_CG017013, isoform A [Clunio marinus]